MLGHDVRPSVQVAALFLLFTASFGIARGAQAQTCLGASIFDHLEWCSRDNGFNEGASCGLANLAATGLSIPTNAPQPVAGNIFKRSDMISLASQAAKAGYRDEAAKTCLCCWAHHRGVQNCMRNYQSGHH